MTLQAAIFDMDGTLIDSQMLWEVVFAEYGRRFGDGTPFAPGEADNKTIRTLPTHLAVELLHDRYGIGESGEQLLAIANEIYVRFYGEEVQLKPGVAEFLEFCKMSGVRMCIATATARNLVELALDHLGIGDYFEQVFSCAELGVGKDVPDVFLLAQEFLGAPLAETWVFEDSLTALETAVKAGFPTVGIYDRYTPRQEDIAAASTVYIGPDETMMKLAE